MQRACVLAVFLLGMSAFAAARAEFIVRIGSTVYVDGKAYDWEEWKKIRDDPQRLAPVPAAQKEVAVSVKDPAREVPVTGPRAASCTTTAYHDEFPGEEERFQCSAALGALTRDEILRAGWKIDLIEKIPAPAGESTQSARGLPLYHYKLVISR